MRIIAVGIAGGSCSGKTTLARKLHEQLGADTAIMLPQDDYFFGLSEAPAGKGGKNFDHPDAVHFDQLGAQLNDLKSGEAIERPLYDFHTHYPRAETAHMKPRPVILIDGILILHHAPLRDMLDLSVFVSCDEETRFQRRLARDVAERGRTPESVHAQFADQVAPMHDLFVEPSKAHADIVVNSPQSESDEIASLQNIIQKITSLIQ